MIRTLALTVGLLAAHLACAWGPVTHAYLAQQVIPEASPQALLGAMCADMNGFLLGDRKMAGNLKRLTHTEAMRLPDTAFRAGMLTHNADWGADRYAHAYHYHPDESAYPHTIFKRFADEFGVSIHEAEDVLEIVLDYVIARDTGEAFVRQIAAAADSGDAREAEMLVAAFAEPPGEARNETADTIRRCFQCHRLFLRQLADGLLMPDEAQRMLLRLAMPPKAGDADRSLQRAVELCADWRAHLNRMAEEIAQAGSLHHENR